MLLKYVKRQELGGNYFVFLALYGIGVCDHQEMPHCQIPLVSNPLSDEAELTNAPCLLSGHICIITALLRAFLKRCLQ